MLGSERFLRACRREQVDRTPVWFMRQAGRYQAAYREIRAQHTLLDIVASSELSARVTMIPIENMPVDAAIIFADILPPLVPMGMQLEFARGEGPVLHNPISNRSDIEALKPYDPGAELRSTLDAISSVRQMLGERAALIGFAGGPFTLASYMIEGGSSRNYVKTKQLMYADEAAWGLLMAKLGDMTADYLIAQIAAGAQCVQLFDSWAGALGPDDYRRYVLPTTRTIIERVKAVSDVPVILFGTNTSGMLDAITAAGSDVVGVDWRISIDKAWGEIGADRAVQGNLDPVRLFDSGESLKAAVKAILDEVGNRPGHIFNLGHGILPGTPEENVRTVAELVHQLSERQH
ncbi:MAG TPA: uroporphyrinogen decarboxylase [Thermomicrobiales bacterium]|nr:uroporphyrinogen decarboxylase [Thermomicrobiales bacterium]